jgi:hypothetical protein
MRKLIVFGLLIFIAIGAAALYGMLHNQISYTVSPEYFTKFKFLTFDLTDIDLPERVRASIVGFYASWWMGLPIGTLIAIPGFAHRGYQNMFRFTLRAMIIAVSFTLLFGICGLIYGYYETTSIDISEYGNWFIPSNVVDLRPFLCAGYMHNSAYLGGILSIFVGWTYQVFERFKASRYFSAELNQIN